MKQNAFLLTATALFSVLLPSAARASVYLGDFDISGSVTIKTDQINFFPLFTIGPSNSLDSFTALQGTSGSVTTIHNPPYSVGTVVPTLDFMSFAAAPNISFTMLELVPGGQGACSAVPAVNQTCTPLNSPYVLQNGPNVNPSGPRRGMVAHSTASFSIQGIEIDSLTGEKAEFTGIISTTLTGPFQTVLNEVNGGGSYSTTYSGSFDVEAMSPEPSFMSVLMVGFLLLITGSAVRRGIRS